MPLEHRLAMLERLVLLVVHLQQDLVLELELVEPIATTLRNRRQQRSIRNCCNLQQVPKP